MVSEEKNRSCYHNIFILRLAEFTVQIRWRVIRLISFLLSIIKIDKIGIFIYLKIIPIFNIKKHEKVFNPSAIFNFCWSVCYKRKMRLDSSLIPKTIIIHVHKYYIIRMYTKLSKYKVISLEYLNCNISCILVVEKLCVAPLDKCLNSVVCTVQYDWISCRHWNECQDLFFLLSLFYQRTDGYSIQIITIDIRPITYGETCFLI